MFLVFLAVWKRPEITEICFMGLNRLKKAGFPVDFLAVISEDSMKPLCKKYGVEYVEHENLPVGRKKNFGLTQAFKRKWDYLVEIGSDDVLKNETFERYTNERKDWMSIGNICLINSVDGDCKKLKSSVSYGVGRCLSRDTLEFARGYEVFAKDHIMSPGRTTGRGEKGFFPTKTAKQLEAAGQVEIIGDEVFRIWGDGLNRGLDNSSNFLLHHAGFIENRLKFDEPVAVGIKSKENIWAWNPDAGEPYDLQAALKGLSIEERTAILALNEN